MRRTILVGVLVLLPIALFAAEDRFDVKLGLWETSVAIGGSGMPAMPGMPQIPPEALSRMPAAQRAQIEAMMKGRGGAPMTTKACITRESLDSGAFGQRDKSCTSKVVSSSLAKQVLHVECVQPTGKTTGDLTLERVDAEHVKGEMVAKNSEGGETREVKMSFETKWVSADCGDIKPIIAK